MLSRSPVLVVTPPTVRCSATVRSPTPSPATLPTRLFDEETAAPVLLSPRAWPVVPFTQVSAPAPAPPPALSRVLVQSGERTR